MSENEMPPISPRGAMWAVGVLFAMPAYVALGIWLDMTVSGWPEAYGSTCRQKCFFDHLWYSPGLLSGGWREIALFVVLWSLPIALAAFLIWAFARKRSNA